MANIFIRNTSEASATRMRQAASARQMDLAEYLEALIKLHDVCRAHADEGSNSMQVELTALGLQTVTR